MRTILRALWKTITAPFRAVLWVARGIVSAIRKLSQKIHAFFTEDEEDTPLGDAIEKMVEHPQGVIEHIDALRKHLLRSVAVLLITTTASLIFVRPILDFLASPLEGGIQSLTAIDVTENISAGMRVALLAGFVVALPYILFELFLFIAPGLHRKFRIRLLLALPIALLLFVGGSAFAYMMLPFVLPIMMNVWEMQTNPRPSNYFSIVTNIMFWIGLFFELPLVAFVLADFGILKAKMLISQWKLALVAIAILAAAITPTTDVLSMAIVMIPMFLLYLISILLVFLAERNRSKKVSEP